MNAAKLLFVLIFVSFSALADDSQTSAPKAKTIGDSSAPTAAESSSHLPRKAHSDSTTVKANTATASPDVQQEDEDIYRIGIDDELQISVWREPELSAPVVVRMDGKITLPLLNDLTVVGLRTEELQTLLAEKLKSFVNEPQVTVIVRAVHSRKVYLFGEVIKQGTYSMGSSKTILELIADAGGLGPFAKGDSIYVLRQRGAGQQVRIPFHYKKALAGHSFNIVLRPGDIVVVP